MVATVDQMTQCTPLKRCLACDSEDLTEFLNLGWQCLANDYSDGITELAEFPLVVNYCQRCFHSQLSMAVDPDLLFKEYSYVSSTTSTLAEYFERFVELATRTFPGRKLSCLDIAGNDGSLLTKFAELGHDVLNVDPARNLRKISEANGVPVLTEYWQIDTYLALPDVYDVIVAMNVLGHVSNPLAFLIGCRNAMADGGRVWIQTSQAEWLEHSEFDCVYSEHISYFNAFSFQTLANRAGLNVLSVQKPAIHGVSYLWELAREGEPDISVAKLNSYESSRFFYDDDLYSEFGMGAKAAATWFFQIIDEYRDAGYACVGYGAAAKGNTLLQFSDVTLDCVVENNPLKVGLHTPGTNIPIVSIDHLTTIEEPLCCVILAWNFAEEIVNRIKVVRDRPGDVFVQVFPERIVYQ